MKTPVDYEERRRAEREDRAWFDRYPDREYRLRRAWSCELTGEPPAGFGAFVILHRQDVERTHAHVIFGAEITFETNIPDAEIRGFLGILAVDNRAMLTRK